ncbi:MAG: DUF2281 domain-containing protein [Nitrospirota bacterium]|nr:DUF2281 domain-containing protein [Nitrospirota bacterium]
MAGTVKTEVLNQFDKLPQKAQQEVADFIAFLGSRYKEKTTEKKEKVLKLKNEAFVGMWKKRKDMQDSGLWVRKVRRSEWADRA